MPKTQFDYESKQLARQKLVNFVIRHYDRGDRKKLKMVCLPGAQALDVYRISDVLGIPRENVTGIERDRKVYDELERHNLGIELFHGIDRNFFETTDDRFDLVNLDYFGTFTTQVAETLSTMMRRKILKSPGVLCTNLYGSRENSEVKDNYNVCFLSKARQDFTCNKLVLDHIADRSNLSDADATIIRSALYRKEQEYDRRKKESREKPLESGRDNIAKYIIYIGTTGNASLLSDELSGVRCFDDVDTDEILRSLDVRFKGVPYEIRNYIMAKANGVYFCEDSESYRYISDDGSPMLTDIFLFDQHREWFDEGRWPVSFTMNKDRMFTVKIGGTVLNESTNYSNPFIKKNLAHTDMVSDYLVGVINVAKERQFLGSSAKPVLSKEKARELVEKGVSSEDILEKYRGVTKQQLAGYKAWKTMKEK